MVLWLTGLLEMADRYKVLNLLKLRVPPTQLLTDTLYEVPAAALTQVGGGLGPVTSPKAVSSLYQTLLTNIVVCDSSGVAGVATTFDITLLSTNSSGDATTTYLFRVTELKANNTQVLTLNATLSAGDKLVATIPTTVGAEVDFTVFGIEMITGSGPR